MLTYLPYARAAADVNLKRLRDAREDERGMTIETVIIIAVMASIAIAIGVILINIFTTKGNETQGQATTANPQM